MKAIKKYKYHILSFIIPLIICIIFLLLKGVFKDIESFFVSDLKGQHIVFYNYLKNLLLGHNSIYYSYYAGMGSKMLPTIAFYLMSPLNIIVLLIKDIRYAILIIYVLKICISGLNMYIFLNYKFNKKTYMSIAFSTCYALSSFVINYYYCIFWFDSIYLAPLVLLGIEKIYKYKKINLLYIFSLSLAIISNIQMGFGLCIFSLIYYIYLFSIKYEFKKDFNKFISLSKIFIISSLCAGAISSGFILPIIKEYKSITLARKVGVMRSVGITSSPDHIIKNLLSVGNIRKYFINVYDPYIYCGIIVTILSILYFTNMNISKRKKKSSLIVIIFFILSFSLNFLNIFWHLSEPILLNYRYSIYFSLFLTIISYENYITSNTLVKKDFKVLAISLLFGLIVDIIYIKEIHIWITLIFIILILLFLILTKNISRKFEIILFLVIITEITFNANLSFYTCNDLPFEKYSSYESLKKLDEFNNFNKGYRVTTDYTYTEYNNDMFLLENNSSLRYFSSIINGSIVNFLYRNSSFSGKSQYVVSSYDSPLLLSLLGNKYFYFLKDNGIGLYEKKKEYNIKSYDYKYKKNKNKKIYLYENPYALSLGYIINSDVKYKDSYDVIDYQNKIIKSFTGNNKEVIKRLEYGISKYDDFCKKTDYSDCKKFYIENETNNKYIYFYFDSTPFYADNSTKIYGEYSTPLVMYDDENYYEIVLIPDSQYDFSTIKTTTYDKNNLIESLKILQENMLTNVNIDKNIMKANLDTSKDGILFLSIPYDKNFRIYVDGKKVKYYPLLDNTFIGLDVKKGKHNIKLVYVDDNLKWYILSSLLSIIVTLIIYKYNNISSKKS